MKVIAALLVCSLVLNFYLIVSQPTATQIAGQTSLFTIGQLNHTRDQIQEFITEWNATYNRQVAQDQRNVKNFMHQLQRGVDDATTKIAAKHQKL